MSWSKSESRWYEVAYKGDTPGGKAIEIHGVGKPGDTRYFPTALIPRAAVELGRERYQRPLTLMMVKIPDNFLPRFKLTPEDAKEGYAPNDVSAEK